MADKSRVKRLHDSANKVVALANLAIAEEDEAQLQRLLENINDTAKTIAYYADVTSRQAKYNNLKKQHKQKETYNDEGYKTAVYCACGVDLGVANTYNYYGKHLDKLADFKTNDLSMWGGY